MTKFFWFVYLFLVFSCKQKENEDAQRDKDEIIQEQKKRIDELEAQNKQTLKDNDETDNTVKALLTPTKYVYVVVKIKQIATRVNKEDNSVFSEFVVNTYVTNISEIKEFDRDNEYRIKDDARKSICRLQLQGCNIQDIELLSFDSYADASISRDKIKYIDESLFTIPGQY